MKFCHFLVIQMVRQLISANAMSRAWCGLSKVWRSLVCDRDLHANLPPHN